MSKYDLTEASRKRARKAMNARVLADPGGYEWEFQHLVDALADDDFAHPRDTAIKLMIQWANGHEAYHPPEPGYVAQLMRSYSSSAEAYRLEWRAMRSALGPFVENIVERMSADGALKP